MQGMVSTLRDRELALVLVSLISEMTDLCIVARNEGEKMALNDVLREFYNAIGPYRGSLKKIRIPRTIVLTDEEYYRDWEKYSGWRLIFLEDSRLRWSILDIFSKYLREAAKKSNTKGYVYLDITKLVTLIDFLCSSVDLRPLIVELEIEDKKKRKEYMEKKKRAEERILSFFQEKLKDKRKAELAYRMLLYVAKRIYEHTEEQ